MLDFLNSLYPSLSSLWEMSVTAAYAAAVVIVLRLLLKKRAPRQVLCLLWLVVFARLLIPASLESPLSIVPNALPGQEYTTEQAPNHPGAGDPVTPIVPQNPVQNQPQNQPVGDMVTPVTSNQNPSLSVPEGVVPTVPDTAPIPEAPATFPWQAVIAGVWLAGAAVMGGYALVSWLRLRRRLFDAIRAKDGAWEHPAVDSPFILGVLRPRIYLPAGLTGQPRQFILCHERAHLRRFDHIVKPVCWVALALHWFNPLVWAAFLLMSRDIESACDEAVVRRLGSGVKADYSETLLALATGRRLPAPCPLAFDEGDARGRIRNVLSYRRPALWAIVVSVIAAALAAVCLLTDPVAAKGPEGDPDPDADASSSQDVENLNGLLDPWMKVILDGERDFKKARNDEAVNIEWLNPVFYGYPEEMPDATVRKLAIIDLDRDGINELVICPADALPDDTDPFSSELVYRVGYLILRRQGDEVYGYAPGYRSFGHIKADGTFMWSSGAANWGIASARFSDDGFEADNITWCASTDDPGVELYFVDGLKATRAEFEAAYDIQDAKPDPVWYTYQDGVLSSWFPNNLELVNQTNPKFDTGEAKLWIDDAKNPYLEWNGSLTRINGQIILTQSNDTTVTNTFMQCLDFDGDGQDEVVITWYINGFQQFDLYEWEENQPKFSATFDAQQLLVRFNQNNVAGYNKDSRGLTVTYAHTEGNDDDPDYYRHYVMGHSTLREDFFDGYENIRDGYTYAYAYQFHLFYWTGSAYYFDFEFCLADETMQTLDYVDVPMDENQELSPYYAGYHYMAYQPVGIAGFYLSYDGTDWRVQEWDELVMDGQNEETQTANPLDVPLDTPIADHNNLPKNPNQWYKVAELPDDMIWMFSRNNGTETLLRWDGNFFQVFDHTAHTTMSDMPRLKKLGGANTYGPLAVISNVDKGTGMYIEELVVYDLDAAPVAIDYTHDWKPLMDDFNENVSWQYDKDTQAITYTYQGQTVKTVIEEGDDDTYRRIEQEGVRLGIGDFVYYRFDGANDGDITIDLTVEMYIGNDVIAVTYPGWVSWTLRFNGSGFDTVPGSCVLGYPGYGV